MKAKSFITGTDSAKQLSNSANASGHVKGHAEPRLAVFTKKENATLVQHIEILDWFHANGKHQSKTARHFDTIYPNLKLKQPMIYEWVKNKKKWQTRWEEEQGAEQDAKCRCQIQHPEITEMMDLWVSKAMRNQILLTSEVLRQKWKAFANLVGLPEDDHLKLSEGWLMRFKKQNGLKEFKRHGDAASSDTETVEAEQKRIQELIEKYGYKLHDIFYMDEMGLFYGYVPMSKSQKNLTDHICLCVTGCHLIVVCLINSTLALKEINFALHLH